MAVEKMSIAKALNESLRLALETDPKVLIMGEDVGKLGGVFRITDGLQKDFGEDRVIDTPLAESGIVGTAIGLALRGYRPIVEIQFDGFVFPAYDQIVTQLAKMHARALGKIKLPVVVRIPYGGGIGAVEHHSESPEALFAHVAGLKVVSPSNASDAYWMMQQAVQSDDPIIFFEPKRRYWDKGEVDTESIPGPLHKAVRVREGSDLTLVAYGPMVKVCLEAAAAAQEEGKSVEVLDLRSMSPIDFDAIADVGREDRPARGRPRGARLLRLRRGDRRPHHRAQLLPPRSAGAQGRRLPRALPAGPAGGRVPAGSGPGARRRRPLACVLRREGS
ncbi:1-deoxy-D-xylulose-5-phosphate synthase [Streptomyces microflavus]